MTTTQRNRYRVSASAGSQTGRSWAVVDTQDRQGGRGMRRVSFHRTQAAARQEAQRMNAAADALPTFREAFEQR